MNTKHGSVNPRPVNATAYREGQWWMVNIPELDVLSQASTKDEVPEVAADLASITLDIPADRIVVSITYSS